MSLDDFEPAVTPEGRTYELERGTVAVYDTPHPSHLRLLAAVRDPLIVYGIAHPRHVRTVAGRGEAKLVIAPFESERRPDLLIYREPPPSGRDIWSEWVPAIVVEIVTPESAEQDYDRKPDEYLAAGAGEYWIVDGGRREMTALERWRGLWRRRVLRRSETYATWRLPGFSLSLRDVFAAG